MLKLLLRASLSLPALESLRALINQTVSICLLYFKPHSLNPLMWPNLKNYISIHVGFDIFQLLSHAYLTCMVLTLVALLSVSLNTAQKWHFALFDIRHLDRQRNFGLLLVTNDAFKHHCLFLICALVTTVAQFFWIVDAFIVFSDLPLDLLNFKLQVTLAERLR
jgi:hypothetical protein